MRTEKQIMQRIATLRVEIKAARESNRAAILGQAIDRRQREIKGLEFALGLEGWQQTWSN